MTEPVPQPPGLPLLGNLRDIDAQNPLVSFNHLARKYGPLYKINLLGQDRYMVSSVALLDELCDEKRFRKNISVNLQQLRNGSGDGLFTAYHDEPGWAAAHRTLTPSFGPIGMSGMYDEMYDIASQLVAKWARLGPSETINPSDDYTRLTLDSIALCAMDKRFNSFYHEEKHPFVEAMTRFLKEAQLRPRRTKLQSMLNRAPERQFFADIASMTAVAKEVIDYRRANPVDKKDLLNALLHGKDPKTGKTLDEQNIMNNLLTFFVAGHETTSAMLSFSTYYMLRNPETYRKAQAEVDAVVGKGPVHREHLNKIPYVEAVLREALRLQSPAPGFNLESNNKSEPFTLGGKYVLPGNASMFVLLGECGRDPQVYGSDAEEFRPERMYGENFDKLPKSAFKVFGNGTRACIGRNFAWQEALLTLALLLQNFDLSLADPSYQLQIQQTLTIKPANFEIRAALRKGIDPIYLEKKMFADAQEHVKQTVKASKANTGPEKQMTVLYGSNAGTCEGLAQSLATSAVAKGYKASVKDLDSAVDKLPTDQPVVVIVSSYEGQPPDNARAFVDWLKTTEAEKVKGVRFSVFGCGHHDWAATYHKIPKVIEQELNSKGATSLAARGGTDVAMGTLFDDFDAWQDEHLWPALTQKSNDEEDVAALDMEISTGTRASHLRHSVKDAMVLQNRLISAPGVPEKWHMEIKLPTDLTYSAGDYLALLSLNNVPTISRVLRRFRLPFDTVIQMKPGSHTTIPTGRDMSLMAILGAYVELNTPATKKNINVLEKYTPDEAAKKRLTEAAANLVSVIEILEAVPEIEIPLQVYLAMLPPMRIRQYSISSSPLKDLTIATITYSVVDNQKGHLGVATNYLKSLQPGAMVQVAVKPSHTAFHLPNDDSTPVIMACAGTGIAPFRGFVEERATKLAANNATTLGPAALFIGCRDPEKDALFYEELAQWEKLGAVKVFHAFSRKSEQSEECKYVQDRLYREKDLVLDMFNKGARAYICGSGEVGKGIADVVAKIAVEDAKTRGNDLSHEDALKWWEKLRNERYAVDVFA